MRDWERATWQTGQTEQTVMARVGELLAQRITELTCLGDRILLLAGKGHNGDDVRLARPHLNERTVQMLEVTDPLRQLPELDHALDQSPKLIVDGLFGIGLDRPLAEGWKFFIDRVNRSSSPILSVDLPSGLNADTGLAEGAAIRASFTLTVGAPKVGLLAPAALPFVGQLQVLNDIGLGPPPEGIELLWTLPTDFRGFPPVRELTAHKGDFGQLVILAGSLGYHGAAVLAARGAQAARPGLITVITTDETYVPIAAQLQSVMVRPWHSEWQPPEKTTAILFGPGLADPSLPAGVRKQALQLWRGSAAPVIADASGLDWLTDTDIKATSLRVITPHGGEAARLLKRPAAAVQADRVAALRELSARLNRACVVLKGHQTLVGSAEGPVYVNGSGGPLLAQGGSGDVLAGFLGGLLSQPLLLRDPILAIRYGVWRHGLAGESANWSGLIEELPVELAQRPVSSAA